MPKFPDVEVIVSPRCTVWYGGGVHLPGVRVMFAEDEVDVLLAQRVVSLATPENVAAIEEAIEKGLPIPGYVTSGEDDVADRTDPRDVARRAAARKRRSGD